MGFGQYLKVQLLDGLAAGEAYSGFLQGGLQGVAQAVDVFLQAG